MFWAGCVDIKRILEWPPVGRPGLLGLSSRFSCWLKSDLGTWSIVSPCARTDPIQIARIFENLHVHGFYFMRNYVLDIPNWQNVPRWSQSSAFSLGALWFSWYVRHWLHDLILPTVDLSENRASPGLWSVAGTNGQRHWQDPSGFRLSEKHFDGFSQHWI